LKTGFKFPGLKKWSVFILTLCKEIPIVRGEKISIDRFDRDRGGKSYGQRRGKTGALGNPVPALFLLPQARQSDWEISGGFRI